MTDNTDHDTPSKDPMKKHRAPPLEVTEEEGIALLNWFEDEDMLKVSMAGSFHCVKGMRLTKLLRKSKQMNCPPNLLFNFIKSRRKYFTNFIGKSERSGSGKCYIN